MRQRPPTFEPPSGHPSLAPQPCASEYSRHAEMRPEHVRGADDPVPPIRNAHPACGSPLFQRAIVGPVSLDLYDCKFSCGADQTERLAGAQRNPLARSGTAAQKKLLLRNQRLYRPNTW